MSAFPSASIPGSNWSGSSRRTGFDILEQSIRTVASTEPFVDYVSFINYAMAADIEVIPHAALRISQTRLGSGAYMTVFRGSYPEKFGDTSLAIKLVDIPLPRSWAKPSEEEPSERGPWEGEPWGGVPALSELRRFKDDWSQQLRVISLELRVLSDRLLRSHPNIVKLLGISFVEERFAEEDSPSALFFKPILILEEAHQDHPTLESFYQHAKSGGEDIPMVLKMSLWRDVGEALSAVHAVGIVHGDVKPNNILLFQNRRDGKLVAKLSDFGGCQPSPSHSAEGTHQAYDLLGTEYWNAPEVYDRSHQYYRAPFRDCFSFGLVGYYVLFESYPFGPPSALTPEQRAGLERGKANWDGLALLVERKMQRQWPHVTSVDAAKYMRSLPEPTDPNSFQRRLARYRRLIADGWIQLGTRSAPERSNALFGIHVSEYIDCRPFAMALAMTLFMQCEPQKRDECALMSRLGIFLEDKQLGTNIRDIWGSGCWHYVLKLLADGAMSPWHISTAHKAGATYWRPRVSWMKESSLLYTHVDFDTDQLKAVPESLRTILKTEYEGRLQSSAGDDKIHCLLQLATLNIDVVDKCLEYYLEAAELGSPLAQSLCARIGYSAFQHCANLPPVRQFSRWLLRGVLGPDDEAAALLEPHTEAASSVLEWGTASARRPPPYPFGSYGLGTTAFVVYPKDTVQFSLLTAILKGDISALSKLLENSEVLTTRFINGDTLIHVAAELDKARTITFLANDYSMFDPELLNSPNAEGMTPLATAMVHGCYEAMLALLNAGAECKRLVSTRMVRYVANMGDVGMISQLLELRDILERDGDPLQGMTRSCPSQAELLNGDFSFFDDEDEPESDLHVHPIFASILGDNIWTLQALLRCGCSQDVWMDTAVPNGSGSSSLKVSLAPIHLACQLRPLHLAVLLRHGADVNRTTVGGLQQTPVHLACTATTQPCYNYPCSRLTAEDAEITSTSLTEMRLCMLRLLARYGKPNYNARDRLGKTALHHCMARRGCLLVIQALVDDYGADLEIRDGQGMTPLHHAVSSLGQELGYVQFCVSRLPDHAIDKPDGQGLTPLMWAVRVRRTESVDFCKCFVERGCSLVRQNFRGETVLHVAALKCDEELFTYVFEETAKVDLLATLSDLVDINGQTFGHIVARSEHSKIRDSLQRVPDKALVRMINRADRDGLTLLHAAAQTGDAGLVEFLLRKGADINRTVEGGFTALWLARIAERSAVVRVLEEHLGLSAWTRPEAGFLTYPSTDI